MPQNHRFKQRVRSRMVATSLRLLSAARSTVSVDIAPAWDYLKSHVVN